MKLTCRQWTAVQSALPFDRDNYTESEPAVKLWDKLEARTWGKDYGSNVAIALTPPEQLMVDGTIEILKSTGRW